MSRALAHTWQPGDEVLVTQLDHDGNIAPWMLAANDAGATIREVRVRPNRAGGQAAGQDLVQGRPGGVPGAAEDPVRDAEFEGQQPGEREDGDTVEGHGPIVSKGVSQATVAGGRPGRMLSA